VVLSRLAIGDLATQFFADKGMFCAGRVEASDMQRVHRATGAVIQSTVNGLNPDVLGTCDLFEERQVGRERYNFFMGCPKAKTATIIIRGGGEAFNDEAERSLHDAIMVVRRARLHASVVAGGGAIEVPIMPLLLLPPLLCCGLTFSSRWSCLESSRITHSKFTGSFR
jgi:T-complex protein 1 subunit eta